MRIIYLPKQEKKTGIIDKYIKCTGLNLLYCSNCPMPLNHAYDRLQCFIAYANNEGKFYLHTGS